MKRFLTIISCAVLMGSTAFAQKKGDMTLGGNLGFSAGSSNWKSITEVENVTTTTKDNTPSGSFSIAPSFSYFVIDNLQLNVGLDYTMNSEKSFDDHKEKTIRDSRHQYTVGIGLNYFVKLCNNFYYTPGFFYDFGGVNINHKVTKENEVEKKTRSGLTTGIVLNIAQFEVKVSNHCGLTLGLLDLDYDYCSTHRTNEKVTYTIKNNDVFFKLSSKIGFKYYF